MSNMNQNTSLPAFLSNSVEYAFITENINLNGTNSIGEHDVCELSNLNFNFTLICRLESNVDPWQVSNKLTDYLHFTAMMQFSSKNEFVLHNVPHLIIPLKQSKFPPKDCQHWNVEILSTPTFNIEGYKKTVSFDVVNVIRQRLNMAFLPVNFT